MIHANPFVHVNILLKYVNFADRWVKLIATDKLNCQIMQPVVIKVRNLTVNATKLLFIQHWDLKVDEKVRLCIYLKIRRFGSLKSLAQNFIYQW